VTHRQSHSGGWTKINEVQRRMKHREVAGCAVMLIEK
jgi:hypothetical protein